MSEGLFHGSPTDNPSECSTDCLGALFSVSVGCIQFSMRILQKLELLVHVGSIKCLSSD